ncbi:hypothetical protein D3C86_1145970 [compost metagenome]
MVAVRATQETYVDRRAVVIPTEERTKLRDEFVRRPEESSTQCSVVSLTDVGDDRTVVSHNDKAVTCLTIRHQVCHACVCHVRGGT